MVKILNDGQNLGLGVAYNRIATAAKTDWRDMLLLLDQDSTPSADMATRLHETYENLLNVAGTAGGGRRIGRIEVGWRIQVTEGLSS